MNLTNRSDQSPRRDPARIYSGMQLPIPRAGAMHPNMMDSEYAGLIVAVINALLNCNQIQFGDRGAVINIPAQKGGSVRIEEWSAAANPAYSKGNMVFYQPDGTPGASTFYALQDVPNGVSPAIGAPYWGTFPPGIPGAWL